MKRSKWDQRIQRADELTSAHPFAAEALRFYKGIATFQKELYANVDAALENGSRKKLAALFDENLDLALLLPKFQNFLSRVGAFSPQPVAESASNLRKQSAAHCGDLLSDGCARDRILTPFRANPKHCWPGSFCSPTRNAWRIEANTSPAMIALRYVLFAVGNR